MFVAQCSVAQSGNKDLTVLHFLISIINFSTCEHKMFKFSPQTDLVTKWLK